MRIFLPAGDALLFVASGLFVWSLIPPPAAGFTSFDEAPADDDPLLSDRAAVAPPDASLRSAPPVPVPVPVPVPGLPPSPHGPVRILVLGPTDLPVPGLALVSRPMCGCCEPEDVPLGTTDAEGRLTAPDLPYDAKMFIADADEIEAPVLGPDLLIHADIGLALRVALLDAESGDAVRGAGWMPKGGARTVNGDARVVAAGPGRSMDLSWSALVPNRYVAFDKKGASGLVSRYATALYAAYPLRREAAIEVDVRDENGRPARDADIVGLDFAERRLDVWSVERFAAGIQRIHGVPFFRGESLSIRAEAPDAPSRTGTWSGPLPEDVGLTIEAQIDLPPICDACEFEGHAFHRFISAIGCGCGSRCGLRLATGNEGAVRVVARRRDKSPAPRASVRLVPASAIAALRSDRLRGRSATCDAAGGAAWTDLAPSDYVVRLEEPGLVPCEATVALPANGDVTVNLVEPDGGDIDVAVLDEDGRGLPFASIAVKTASGLAWLDVADGVQRIDGFTDHLGRRRLPHVEPGAVDVTAEWGSRKGKATVAVDEGGRAIARVVVK